MGKENWKVTGEATWVLLKQRSLRVWLIVWENVVQERNGGGPCPPRAMGLRVEVVGGPLLPLETLGLIFCWDVPVPFSCDLLYAFIQLKQTSNTCISSFLIAKRTYILTSCRLRRLEAGKALLLLICLWPFKELYVSKVIKKTKKQQTTTQCRIRSHSLKWVYK